MQLFRDDEVTMRLPYFRIFIFLCLCATAVVAQSSNPAAISGFDKESSDRELQLEKRLDSLIKKDNLRDWMKRLSARPHHLGSPYGKENADYIASLFRSWG